MEFICTIVNKIISVYPLINVVVLYLRLDINSYYPPTRCKNCTLIITVYI